MLTALLKLFDIAARSLFVLVVLYALPTAVSGQFGLILTVMGLFAFVCGYERYVDIQRNIVGKSEREAVARFVAAIRFYAMNYLIWFPILSSLLFIWLDVSIFLLVLVVIIAIGEHLSNEFYRMAVVSNRNKTIVFISMCKNMILLGGALAGSLFFDSIFSLNFVFFVWALMSIIGLVFSFYIYIDRVGFISFLSIFRETDLKFKEQYSVSYTHFRLGLLAVLALQADRLLAGMFLTLEESGEYFRHLFLAMSAYQAMNVASYNKILPKVYSNLKVLDVDSANKLILKERIIYGVGAGAAIFSIYLMGVFDVFKYLSLEQISPIYLMLVLAAYLFRGVADFNSMILNGLFQEKKVLYSHAITVCVACVGASFLASIYGIEGLLYALVLNGVVYLFVSRFYVNKALAEARANQIRV